MSIVDLWKFELQNVDYNVSLTEVTQGQNTYISRLKFTIIHTYIYIVMSSIQ